MSKQPPVNPNFETGRKSWYRGKNVNASGNIALLKKGNAIEKYVLKGWLPSEPFIEKNSHVVGVGSCFAWNVTKYLHKRGYRAHLPEDGVEIQRAGSNHTFALRQLLEWAWTGKEPIDETWYDKDINNIERTEQLRQEIAEYFSAADVFILTLGLSEVWYNKQTNDVFWRAVPQHKHDPNKHGFRVTTVEENKENLHAVLDLIKKYAPKAKIIVTLSPVPLRATFRPISQMSANSVSKAILRVTIDEVWRERDDFSYWPSYEIVKEFLPATKGHPYDPDNIHVTDEAVAFIMKHFEKHFCIPEDNNED